MQIGPGYISCSAVATVQAGKVCAVAMLPFFGWCTGSKQMRHVSYSLPKKDYYPSILMEHADAGH